MKFRILYGITLSTLLITPVLFVTAGSVGDLIKLCTEKPFGIASVYVVTAIACAALVDNGPNSESYSSY